MDFSRLVGGQDPSVSRQLAEQLLSNALFRDAAVKATKEINKDKPADEVEAATGLDNLLNELSAALTQAADDEGVPATGTGNAVASLLNHPAIQEAFNGLDLETALGLKVLLGQVPAEAAQKAVDLLTRLPASTVYQVKSVLQNLNSDQLDKGVKFFQAMFSDRGQMVFTQGDNRDNYLNSTNSKSLSGADLNKFLQTAYHVMQAGYDIGKYLDHATNVLNKGDYDDFSRFLSVTDMMTYKKQNLDTFFEFGDKLLNEKPRDYEGNVFQAYTAVVYGAKLEDYIDIANDLQTSDFEGRNNMVDLTRIVVDFHKAKGYTPMLYKTLAEEARSGGDVRAMMDEYMAVRGLEDKSPDFSKFDRIERIDGGTMTIKQGESAAIFAQAISTTDGLLPESVLFWSSLEKGAMARGSSYFDLSKLGPGTYHIACKIGNYPGTDTAFKTVIIEPADESTSSTDSNSDTPQVPQAKPVNEIVLPEDGQIKVTVKKGSAALRSDLYMKLNLKNLELVAENAQQGANVSVQKTYQAGDKLDFAIKTYHPNGEYEHSTEGKSQYARIMQTSPTTWKVCFEDLEEDEADWDFDDVEIEIELMKLVNGENDNTEEVDGGVSVGGAGSSNSDVEAAALASAAAAAEQAAKAVQEAEEAAAAAKAAEEAAKAAAIQAETEAAERAAAAAAEQAAREEAARLAQEEADRIAAAAAEAAAAAQAAREEAARLAQEEADRAAAAAAAAAAEVAAAREAWYANAMSKEDAINLTRKAISDISLGKPISASLTGLTNPYFAAVDQQTRTGIDYAEMVGDAGGSRVALKNLLSQFLRQLQTGVPSVTAPSTGTNPYA